MSGPLVGRPRFARAPSELLASDLYANRVLSTGTLQVSPLAYNVLGVQLNVQYSLRPKIAVQLLPVV